MIERKPTTNKAIVSGVPKMLMEEQQTSGEAGKNYYLNKLVFHICISVTVIKDNPDCISI